MVGLSLANQLLNHFKTAKILIIDKEESLGRHSSGRNSGVMHAGIYYKPDSLKAKICTKGARRLKEWIHERNISINQCGKVIVPTREELDPQLDELRSRGTLNGATVEMLDENDLKIAAPYVRSASGRALWSPNTAVVKPIEVVSKLTDELKEKKITFIYNQNNLEMRPSKRSLKLSSGEQIYYGHLFNCTGLNADKIAHIFGVGEQFTIMPFKGLYWQLKKTCDIQPKVNVYPVPDLKVPFLGVHFTPSVNSAGNISIGPTATMALGRENYKGITGLEPKLMIENVGRIIKQYAYDQGNIRNYMHQQAFLNIFPLLVQAAQELIPNIKTSDIEKSEKVAIRPQLFNKKFQKLEDDFVCLKGNCSTHVLNAISPAFTASFELADLIINESEV